MGVAYYQTTAGPRITRSKLAFTLTATHACSRQPHGLPCTITLINPSIIHYLSHSPELAVGPTQPNAPCSLTF